MSAGIVQSLNFKIVVLPVKLNLAGLTFCIFDSPFLRILQREVCSSIKYFSLATIQTVRCERDEN